MGRNGTVICLKSSCIAVSLSHFKNSELKWHHHPPPQLRETRQTHPPLFTSQLEMKGDILGNTRKQICASLSQTRALMGNGTVGVARGFWRVFVRYLFIGVRNRILKCIFSWPQSGPERLWQERGKGKREKKTNQVFVWVLRKEDNR